jgi:nucleotide sugar dehydrogenase
MNESYVCSINDKTFRTSEPGVNEALATASQFEATADVAAAADRSNLIFILVQTPTSGGQNYYDHSTLADVLHVLNTQRLENKHIVICSTVMPGFIRNIGRHLLRDCRRTTLSYNPAFVAQGDVMSGFSTGGWFGMVLVGAEDDTSFEILREIYNKITEGKEASICRMTPESAEICKLASNCFRTTKISFANMVGDIADRTPGADKNEICAALGKDKSIGPLCMRPGYGYGGPCYPRDNRALSLYAEKLGVTPKIPRSTDEYNDFHHDAMAEQMVREGVAREAHVFESVGYKDNIKVPMIDNSPKLAVASRIAAKGLKVIVRDRIDTITAVMKEYGSLFTYEIIDEQE